MTAPEVHSRIEPIGSTLYSALEHISATSRTISPQPKRGSTTSFCFHIVIFTRSVTHPTPSISIPRRGTRSRYWIEKSQHGTSMQLEFSLLKVHKPHKVPKIH